MHNNKTFVPWMRDDVAFGEFMSGKNGVKNFNLIVIIHFIAHTHALN